MLSFYDAEAAEQYFAEAIDLVRASGDKWSLYQIFSHQATVGVMAGEPIAARAAAEAGRDLADAIGDSFFSRTCRAWLGTALTIREISPTLSELAARWPTRRRRPGTPPEHVWSRVHGTVLAFQGKAGCRARRSAIRPGGRKGNGRDLQRHVVLPRSPWPPSLAVTLRRPGRRPRKPCSTPFLCAKCSPGAPTPAAEAALACGDLDAARRWADEAVAVVPGWWKMNALTVRAFVAIAQGEPEQAERDAHEALMVAVRIQGYLRVADTLECLARLAADDANHLHAARLLGAADGLRQRTGHARFPMYQAGYDAAVNEYGRRWGRAILTPHGPTVLPCPPRKPSPTPNAAAASVNAPRSGWGSLTPMENDVVRLVREGLGNKDIGARLFISPRTVQTHLTHVYAKLGLTSRVQLVQLSLGGGQNT